MRQPRTLVRKGQPGYYHVICRMYNRFFYLDDNEKEILLNFLTRDAAFSGADILTYSLMSNHLHILVRIQPPKPVSDSELLRRTRILYGERKFGKIMEQWETWREEGSANLVDGAMTALRKRLFSLSQFCKTFKELYAMSYNRRNKHETSVWGGRRFKSLLISPDAHTLLTIASYIDLNAVRAGIVKNAANYPWSGYGAAVSGGETARNGIRDLITTAYGEKRAINWDEAQKAYAACVNDTIPDSPDPAVSHKTAASMTREEIAEALGSKSPIPWHDLTRCRVREFSNGEVLGPARFVRENIISSSGAEPRIISELPYLAETYTPVRIRGQSVTLPDFGIAQSSG